MSFCSGLARSMQRRPLRRKQISYIAEWLQTRLWGCLYSLACCLHCPQGSHQHTVLSQKDYADKMGCKLDAMTTFQKEDKPISFPVQQKVGTPLSARSRWPNLYETAYGSHLCTSGPQKNVFQINTYFQKGTPQLVTWNSLSTCRSNSLESIKTPKGTPCSPP